MLSSSSISSFIILYEWTESAKKKIYIYHLKFIIKQLVTRIYILRSKFISSPSAWKLTRHLQPFLGTNKPTTTHVVLRSLTIIWNSTDWNVWSKNSLSNYYLRQIERTHFSHSLCFGLTQMNVFANSPWHQGSILCLEDGWSFYNCQMSLGTLGICFCFFLFS